MIILYDNLVQDATITASTEHSDYDFDTAFNDSRLSRVGRTTDHDSEWIKFSFTAAVSVSKICILDNNLTDSATVTLEGNSSDAWVTPAFSEEIENSYDGIFYTTFTAAEYQYWRITIADTTNADEYIEVSKVFLGSGLTMPGMNLGSIVTKKSNSVATKSPTGQLYGDRRINPQGAEISFSEVGNADKVLVDAFISDVDVVEPFVMLIWEESLDVQPPIYCALTEMPAFQRSQSNGLLWNFTLKIEECF